MKPFVSKIINGDIDSKGLERSFGDTWQECVRLVYFRIVASRQRIQEIVNVAYGRPSDDYCTTGNFTFALMDKEFVTKVDVKHTDDCITAVRFHTNKQVSQWYGYMIGKTESVVAPDGYCIHSFVGRCTYPNNLANGVTKLGVFFRPSHQVVALQGRFIYSDASGSNNLVEACPDVSAIVVCTEAGNGKRIHSIYTVSASQLAIYNESLNLVTHPVNEHWLMLIPDEQIIALHILTKDKRIQKLRMVTTFRTTPWFGAKCDGDTQVFDLTGQPEGAYICGFHNSDTSGIGAVYWAPEESASVGLHEVE